MVLVNIVNNFATKIHIFWYLSLVEKPGLLSGPIRMEGMQFASKIRKICIQIGWKTLTNTKLSSFELLSIFDLASCFLHTMYGFVFKGLILLRVPILETKL